MNAVDLLRFVKGYVCFSAKGGFPERFINLCAGNRIHIWNVSAKNKEITANINTGDFKKIKHCAKMSGVKITIIKKCGLPFFFLRHKHRVGILVSAVIFSVFMIVMPRFVWCIEATGSEKFSQQQIIEVAEKYGLRHGTFIPFYDEREAARKIVNDFDGKLLWASVNIKGSRAVIEVRDFVQGIDENYSDEPCNIVADSDGVVLSVETAKGKGMVSSGSGVSKGDLLISGVLDGINMSTRYCHAKGKVTALTRRNCELFCESEALKFIKVQSYYSLYIFGVKIPLGFYKSEKDNLSFCYKTNLVFDNKILPFGILKTTVAEFEKIKESNEHNILRTVNSYTDKTYSMFSNTTVMSSIIDVDITKKKIKLSGNYECIDFIGRNQPIIIENS